MSLTSIILLAIIGIAKYTWWFLTPMVLWPVLKDMWLLSRMMRRGMGMSHVVLEIKIPEEIIKTPKAMEVALTGIHGAVDIINFQDKWKDGKGQPVFSLELVGIDGEMHFFIRCERKFQDFVEAKIYGQYPDAEVHEVDDYTKSVPNDMPNKSWDVWGTDMVLLKNEAYPMRTYEFFEDIEEERRLDPLSSLAEVISKMQEGEQLWIQILIFPVFDFEWVKDSKKISDKLMGRKEPPKNQGVVGGTAEFLGKSVDVLAGKTPEWKGVEKEEDKSDFMRFSKGEQRVVEAIENKRGKAGFKTTVRTLYVARREVMNKTNIAALQGIFRQISDQNLNGLRIQANTKPSSSLRYLKKTRNHRRKLRILRMYKMRMMGLSKPYILNVEELATIFHFPGRVVRAPSTAASRMSVRQGEPPSGLPVG